MRPWPTRERRGQELRLRKGDPRSIDKGLEEGAERENA